MSTSKHIDKICIAVLAMTLVLTLLFMCGKSLGIKAEVQTPAYEKTLFDTSYVHKIDLVMDEWDSFLVNCESEEYSLCTVVIDGTKHSNIAIRAKGNTSLSTVSTLGSDRYSFKLEFDHYDSSNLMDGLDKLCLNNLIQDNTMMKDYLVYQMMNDFGVDSPLCSFAYLTVNGEDWGLYLAVEGIEDSFLSRNYGSEIGDLYKPDSISFGGGRGNGKGFNMEDFDFNFDNTESEGTENSGNEQGGQQGGFNPNNQGGQPGGMNPNSQGDQPSGMNTNSQNGQQGGMDSNRQGGQQGGFDPTNIGELPEGFDPTNIGELPEGFDPTNIGGSQDFGMGSDDVKLKYIDDDPDSYSNIFSSAKTNVTTSDQKRLIQSLKNLSNYNDLENTVDVEEVMRYFVVHNFVCNGDSYTGSMIHNYYLYEEDGVMSMIPWDYNLAYGTFQGNNASDTVNTSIDSPISGGSVDDRPMLGWIFSDENYTEQYHQLFAEFLDEWFKNGELAALIEETADMIRPYVEKDPTKFCTTEEFETGVTALTQFVTLRAEAVEKQLAGDNTKVDTGNLNLSDMGTMNNNAGGGGQPGQDMPGGDVPTMPDGDTPTMPSEDTPTMPSGDTPTTPSGDTPTMPSGDTPTMPSGDTPTMPSGDTPTTSNGDTPTMPDGNVPTMPDGEGENDFVNPFEQGGGTAGTSDTVSWILVALSVLVLAAGLLIAMKKKY